MQWAAVRIAFDVNIDPPQNHWIDPFCRRSPNAVMYGAEFSDTSGVPPMTAMAIFLGIILFNLQSEKNYILSG